MAILNKFISKRNHFDDKIIILNYFIIKIDGENFRENEKGK